MVLLLGPCSMRAGGQNLGRPCASGAQRNVFERLLVFCVEGHREEKRGEGSGRRKIREEEELHSRGARRHVASVVRWVGRPTAASFSA